MTAALRPADAPDMAEIDTTAPRRRRHRDASTGISAAELLARYSEAGFDTPASGRHATRSHGPDLERIDGPAGGDDTVVTQDALPAGVTARSAIGLIKGDTSSTGPFGTRPRAVAATMSATLVGATAVMGVVTTLGSPDQAPDARTANIGLAGVDHRASMQLSVPAAGSEDGTGTSEAGDSVSSGLELVTAAVPQTFEQADAARIAAIAKAKTEKSAADARATAAKARSTARDGAGTSTVSGDPVTDLTGSSAGLQALAAAKSKLGLPYQWGATGPTAFDCSGLMLWAFKQIGIHLPRTSSAQAHADGKSVSRSELKPGDLVFFYSPVSHVGIYAGNGKVLHASTSGQPVKYSNVDDMPFNSALRVT